MTSSLKPFHGSPWSSDELACFLSFRFCSSLPGRLHRTYPRPYKVFPLWLSAVPGTWDQLPWTRKMEKPHSFFLQLKHHCIHKHLPETPSVLCPHCALPAPLLWQFSHGTHLMYVYLPNRLCIYWESNLVDFCIFPLSTGPETQRSRTAWPKLWLGSGPGSVPSELYGFAQVNLSVLYFPGVLSGKDNHSCNQ